MITVFLKYEYGGLEMRNRLLALLVALALILGMLPVQSFAAEMTSEVIIAPQYEDAKSFSDGYAAVKKDGKWGYIDEEGNVVVDFKYDWANFFSEGVALVATLEELSYDYGGDSLHTEKRYVVHLIDASGMDVVLTDSSIEGWGAYPVGYDSYPVTVWYNEEIGGMDPESEAEMESTWFCSDGVVYANGYLYHTDGSQILLKSFDGLFVPEDYTWDDSYFDYYSAIGPCVDGVIPMMAGVMGLADGYQQAFYMDLEGNIIKTFTPANWDTGEGISEVYAPDEGLILVTTLAGPVPDMWGYCYIRYGVMDMDGSWVIQPEHTNYYVRLNGDIFHDGMLPMANEDERWGVFNTSGELVVDYQYAWIGTYSTGYAAAQLDDGTCVYLDTQGNTYQIGGIDGGIANVSICSSFNSDGVAAVYNVESGEAYCILNKPVDGVFPAIEGSDIIDPSVYFPGYDGTGVPTYTAGVADIVTIQENGLYGFMRLNLEAAVNPFTDVPEGAWYYDPVLWAVENGITTGSSDTTFNPGGDCLRAQVVTFLWRAAGEPEPTSTNNPFTDVDEGDWYYDAVLWAVEKGITTGTSETTFSPTAKCNRAQTVTFLYRAMGEPEYSATTSPFTDVKPSAWYGPAVLWAVENEITNGMDATTFGVNGICNRAQVVTFLYRAYN